MIGFLHIPKTGGTSLRAAFGDSGSVVWRPRGARYTMTLPDVDLSGVDVVTGHIPFAVFSHLPITMWVTVLRDPVERWLSHHFAEAGDPEPEPVPDNLTCRMLTDLTKVDVGAALEALAQFDHVGFTDRLDATFAHFGLPTAHERCTIEPRDVPTWLYDAAHEANRHDLRLYQEAR